MIKIENHAARQRPSGWPGMENVSARHFAAGLSRPVDDSLVVEGPLQIILDGVPYSVTMRTPGEDPLLAQGLLFTEGLLACASEAAVCVSTDSATGGTDTVSVTRNEAARARKSVPRRRLASNASCGICGLESAADLTKPAGRKHSLSLSPSLLPRLQARMRSRQALFAATGGSHAAALFDIQGELLVLMEDVGRHNAVDKAIGFLFSQNSLSKAAILCISGRVSYEIVTKAARAGIAFLVAVSAPSTLAVEMCREAGITLIAFCRGERATVYSHGYALEAVDERV